MKSIKCLGFILLFVVMTNNNLMTLTSAQSTTISPACIGGLTPLISNQELSACMPLASLAPLASGGFPTDTALAQAADKLCGVNKCSDSLITTIRNNVEQACATDLTNQVPTALAVDFVFSYYSPIRDSLCFKNSTNGYCFIETIDNLKEYSKDNTTESLGSMLDIISQAPTSAVCTTCNEAITNTFFNYQNANPDVTKRFATQVASVKSTFGTKCGADFTSGKVPNTNTNSTAKTSDSNIIKLDFVLLLSINLILLFFKIF